MSNEEPNIKKSMRSEGGPRSVARPEEKITAYEKTIAVTTFPKCPGTLLVVIKEQQILLVNSGII